MPEIDKVKIEKLEGLLQKNLESSAEVLEAVNSIKRYIRWQQVWSTLRFLLIAIPVVLGFIYLPPLLKNALQTYKQLLQ